MEAHKVTEKRVMGLLEQRVVDDEGKGCLEVEEHGVDGC